MLTVLALAMIILFIVLLSMKKLSVFTSLTLVPFVFGIIAALLPGLLAAQVVVILLAARLGFKERKRLGYTTAQGKGVS